MLNIPYQLPLDFGADEHVRVKRSRKTPDELRTVLGDSLFELHRFPDVPRATISRFAPAIGAAGEALFASWAAQVGLAPATAGPGVPYDHFITVGGTVLRVQVKTTSGPGDRDGRYRFNVARGNSGDPHGTQPYQARDFDILVCVALDRPAMVLQTPDTARTVFAPEDLDLAARTQVVQLFACLFELEVIDAEAFDRLRLPTSPVVAAA